MTPRTAVAGATYRREVVDDTKAQVWVDPANKVDAKADGSYSLTVKGPGTYQVTAGYTGKDGNYKNSDPQTVKVTGQHNLNIPLKYGYTTIVSGVVWDDTNILTPRRKSGATVIAEVNDVEAGRVTSDSVGNFSITVSHPGKLELKASSGTLKGRTEFETKAGAEPDIQIFIRP